MVMAAGNAPQPDVCTRSCWGARSPRSYSYMSSLNRAVIHHTAQPGDYNTGSLSDSAANVRSIQNLHMDVNGWSDIGYNFLVDKLGNIFEGRYNSMYYNTRGAHDAVNYNSFGYNVMGYMHYPYNQQPTTAMRESLYDVIAWRMPDPFDGYGSGYYNGKTVGYVCGHRDVGATACPGDLMYQYIGTNYWGGEARNEINDRIQGVSSGIIVDNADPGFVWTKGQWSESSGSGYYGDNSLYALVGGEEDECRWTPDLPDTGIYEVYVWWVASWNRSSDATYVINHAGGQSTHGADQTQNGGQWMSVGQYTFEAGTSGWVSLADTGNGDVVSADAVRFEYVGPPEYVVDNTNSGFSSTGTWSESASSGYYGSNSYYAIVGGETDVATWEPWLPMAGNYEVYVWWVEGSNRSSNATYTINHAGGQSTHGANQTTNGGQWMSVGSYIFDSGWNASVSIEDTGDGDVVSADAVKFAYLGPPEVIVDNMDAGFSASSNWFESTSVSGYYASNYHARATESASDSAAWEADLSDSGSYKVYARWTTGSNRATSAPYIVYHDGGSTTVYCNQQEDNGVWKLLGTFNMNAGTATRVRLSCWTSSGSYVIADAIKLVKQ